jgi:hypothetical protein
METLRFLALQFCYGFLLKTSQLTLPKNFNFKLKKCHTFSLSPFYDLFAPLHCFSVRSHHVFFNVTVNNTALPLLNFFSILFLILFIPMLAPHLMFS